MHDGNLIERTELSSYLGAYCHFWYFYFNFDYIIHALCYLMWSAIFTFLSVFSFVCEYWMYFCMVLCRPCNWPYGCYVSIILINN
jgi:hypothetical protein